MNLNTQIWGTYEDNAQPITSGTSGDALHYSDKAGAESLLAYANVHGRSEPIDESINYWQLADFSSLNYQVYLKLNGNNMLEYTTTKTENPMSIFLAKTTPSNIDMSFNPTASGNRMWNDFVTGSTGYTNNHKILPWFDYNKVLLRPSLYVYKLDENDAPSGSLISTGDKSKIYNFFHDEENGVPIREQYVITGINLYFLYGSETSQFYSAYDYPCIATSTALEVPKPNYYLNSETYFNTYQRIGSMNIGSNLRQLNITQTGAYGQNTASSSCYIYDPAYWDIREYMVGTTTQRYFAYTGTYEDLLRQLATIGFWFRDDVEGGTYSATGPNAKTIGPNCTDDHCFLPEIKNGRTTGNYKKGSAAGADPQAQWGADWRDNAGYTGDKPYDGGGGDRPRPDPDPNPISPTTPGFSLAVENGSVSYVITQTEWKRVWNDIYGGTKSQWKSLIDGLALYGSNPLNAILNYRWYPFLLSASQTDAMRLGSTVIKPITHVYHYISTASEAFNSTAAHFWWGDDKNFINTRKTKARLFLPFYGFYDLPTTLLLEKELTIQFQYNLPDDTAVWFIEFGGSIYDYVECQPYIEIPITGDNSLQIAAAKAQRNLSIAMTVGAAVAGAAIGGAVGLTQGVVASGFGTAADIAESGIIGTAGLLWGNASYAELAMGLGGAALGAAGPLAGGGAKAANTIMQSALQIGNLSTNVPVHSAGSDTTFLHMPMTPYVELYVNNIQDDFDENGYKVNVGIACDKWAFTSDMPEGSLLQTTGVGNMSTEGMELSEVQELNGILQSGFYL